MLKETIILFCAVLATKNIYADESPASIVEGMPKFFEDTGNQIKNFKTSSDTEIQALQGATPENQNMDSLTQFNSKVEEELIKCLNSYRAGGLAAVNAMRDTAMAVRDKEINEKLKKTGNKKGLVKGSGIFSLATTAKDDYRDAAQAYSGPMLLCSGRENKNAEQPTGEKICQSENLTFPPTESERAVLKNIKSYCHSTFDAIQNRIVLEQGNLESLKNSATATANKIKWGAAAGATAIVGGIMYKNKQDEKEEKEKKQKLKKEIENGIARKEDGTKTNCLTPGTYANAECKPVLQQYCAKDENAHKGGCVAFQNKLCSEADASQSYCVSKDVKDYCKQEGPLIGQSPACIWVKNRPKSCDTDPENIQCLAAMSPAQLNAECPKFPNDPLCQAHMAGKVVTQPMTESQAAEYSTTSTSNAGGLNNIIGSSDQSSITSQSNWKSTSAAYRKLCSSKQLRGCN